MKKLILLLTFIFLTLNASIIEGTWYNSSHTKIGELQELKIKANSMQPFFKTRHNLKALPLNRTLGKGIVRASNWQKGRSLVMILAQYIGNGKLSVEVAESIYNIYNPIIHKYIFTKTKKINNKFPFRGEWVNLDPLYVAIDRLKITKEHGKIIIKAWRKCGYKQCLISKVTAKEIGNRLYVSMYDGRVRIKAIMQGMNYNVRKKRYEKLKIDITTYIEDITNRQTIYLFRKKN